MIRLVAVPPASVEPIWPRVDAAFFKACEKSHGMFCLENIRADAKAGRATIWIAAEERDTEVTAACVTSITSFPGGMRALIVGPLGGKVAFDIFDFRATLEKHAQAKGCNAVLFMVPRRWANRLPDYSYTTVLMSKEIP